MAKLKKGDKVRITYHPTKPQYERLPGAIYDIRWGLGPVSGTGKLPNPKDKEKYDVQIQDRPSLIVRDLDEEWLELL